MSHYVRRPLIHDKSQYLPSLSFCLCFFFFLLHDFCLFSNHSPPKKVLANLDSDRWRGTKVLRRLPFLLTPLFLLPLPSLQSSVSCSRILCLSVSLIINSLSQNLLVCCSSFCAALSQPTLEDMSLECCFYLNPSLRDLEIFLKAA